MMQETSRGSDEITHTNNTVRFSRYLSRPYTKIVRGNMYVRMYTYIHIRYILYILKTILSPLEVNEHRTIRINWTERTSPIADQFDRLIKCEIVDCRLIIFFYSNYILRIFISRVLHFFLNTVELNPYN